jgi:hypothetical protein
MTLNTENGITGRSWNLYATVKLPKGCVPDVRQLSWKTLGLGVADSVDFYGNSY